MKKLILCATLILPTILFAQNTKVEHKAHPNLTPDVAAVISNLSITGIAVIDSRSRLRPQDKVFPVAVVNDRLCKENQSFTVNLKTGELLVRTKDEKRRWVQDPRNLGDKEPAPRLKVSKITLDHVMIEYRLAFRETNWMIKVWTPKRAMPALKVIEYWTSPKQKYLYKVVLK